MHNAVTYDIYHALDVKTEMKCDFLELLEKNPLNFHDRNNLNGHITASMLVFNADFTKVLLTFHKKFQRWLQLGGHWDDLNESCLETAIREMYEEGFGDKEVPYQLVLPQPIDLDKHDVVDHVHYDVCYACSVEDESLMACSHESEDVKWIDVNEVLSNKELYRPRIGRMILKVQNHFLNHVAPN
jgi:ADP-ribose pyrophosphatase YjhB (NUDIX family)